MANDKPVTPQPAGPNEPTKDESPSEPVQALQTEPVTTPEPDASGIIVEHNPDDPNSPNYKPKLGAPGDQVNPQ